MIELSQELKEWISAFIEKREPGSLAMEDVLMLMALKGDAGVTSLRNGELVWKHSKYLDRQELIPEMVKQTFLFRVYELCCMHMVNNLPDGGEVDPFCLLLLALTGNITLLGVTSEGALEYRQNAGRWVAGRRIGDVETSGGGNALSTIN